MMGIFLAASVVAAAYFVLKRRRARSGASPFSSRKQFHLVHAANEDLTLEADASSEANGIMT
jgi:hypothetical protein